MVNYGYITKKKRKLVVTFEKVLEDGKKDNEMYF